MAYQSGHLPYLPKEFADPIHHPEASGITGPVPFSLSSGQPIDLTIQELFALVMFEEYPKNKDLKAFFLLRMKNEGANCSELDLSMVAFRIVKTCHTLLRFEKETTSQRHFIEDRIAKVITNYFPKLQRLILPLCISHREADAAPSTFKSNAFLYRTANIQQLQLNFKNRTPAITFVAPPALPTGPHADMETAKIMIEFVLPPTERISIHRKGKNEELLIPVAWPKTAPAAPSKESAANSKTKK